MTDYKLYCLDGAKRIARAADVISARSDEEAVAAARELGKPMACELWLAGRPVATIPGATAKVSP